MSPEPLDTTDDGVLGGRLRLLQPRRGHRVGHDAILLAAAVDARAGQNAVDLGAGIGGAGLALAARVPGVFVTLVEIEPALNALAAENIVRNGLSERVRALCLDVADAPAAIASADHVLMNPPFNDPARQQSSPDALRRLAHAAAPETLATWVDIAHRLLRPQGILTLIWRADAFAAVTEVLAAGFGKLAVRPVHGMAGQPAIRVLVRAIKDGRGPLLEIPALVLTGADGRPTAEAEAILRMGEAIALDAISPTSAASLEARRNRQ